MEMFLLGIGLIYGLFVWRAWKKTALDACRDKLFDIRDDARTHFIERGFALDDRVYLALRQLLNAQIRYTKRLTFPTFLAMVVATRDSQELMDKFRREIDLHLKTSDNELATYIQEARMQAAEALTQYLFETSAFIMFSVIVAWPFYVFNKLWRLVSRWAEHHSYWMSVGSWIFFTRKILGTLFKIAPLAGLLMTMPARAGIGDRHTTSASMLEEYAYEKSFTT